MATKARPTEIIKRSKAKTTFEACAEKRTEKRFGPQIERSQSKKRYHSRFGADDRYLAFVGLYMQEKVGIFGDITSHLLGGLFGYRRFCLFF